MTKGYSHTSPIIKKVRFEAEKMHISLQDGRELIIPLRKFPAIRRLSPAERAHYQILDGIGIAFDILDETFHISQFLGEDNRVFPCNLVLHAH